MRKENKDWYWIGFLGLFKAGIEWIKNKTIFTKEDFEKLPSGDDCVIMCAGINSSAKAKIGSWITLAEWKYSKEKQRYIPFSVVTKQVDGIEIKEDVYYTLQDGKFKESEQQ